MREPIDPTARARAKLTERRQRVSHLRRRVAVVAGSVFLAGWGVVFGQLALGHDPALATATAKTAQKSGSPVRASTSGRARNGGSAQRSSAAPSAPARGAQPTPRAQIQPRAQAPATAPLTTSQS